MEAPSLRPLASSLPSSWDCVGTSVAAVGLADFLIKRSADAHAALLACPGDPGPGGCWVWLLFWPDLRRWGAAEGCR